MVIVRQAHQRNTNILTTKRSVNFVGLQDMDIVQPAHLVSIDTVTVATNAFGAVLVPLGIVRPVRTKSTRNET